MLAALVAICHALPTVDYEVNNPVLVAFEEAIKESVASVPVPPFEPRTHNEFRNLLDSRKYKEMTEEYEKSSDLYRKVKHLQDDLFSNVKAIVVEDVLRKSKEKLHASTDESAKNVILAACEDLKEPGYKAIRAEETELWTWKQHLNGDEKMIRAFNLFAFCKFVEYGTQ